MTLSPVKAVLSLCAAILFSEPSRAQTILREYWLGIPGDTVADLTNHPSFPFFPTGRETPATFEGPINWDDNYGARYRGYVRPTTTGNYTFYIAGDNQCELWLSTDEDPNKRRLIARVLTWTGSRVWQEARDGNAAAQRSAPIQLTAGLRYYIEALQKEGTTNDCLAVGWTLPNGTQERPIPTTRLAPFILSTNAPSITSQPADITIFEGQEARFAVVAAGMEPLTYKWERDGVPLIVEESPTLVFTPRREDSGSKYRCIITNPKGEIISREALLTVNAEATRPTIAVMAPEAATTVRSLTQIEITFSEPVSGVNASDLLINNIPATNVTGSAAGPYVFKFPAASSGANAISFAANHGIVDLSELQNPFVPSPVSITVDPNSPLPKIRISEFAASNETGLRDEDAETPDWIEIENFGTNSVNLKGWSLSDDRGNPSQWIFPSVNIPAGARLIVFASGKDRKTSPLHTNFLLGEDGESLGLYDASSPRAVVSSFDPYPEQRVNHSYGLDPAGVWKYYAAPTPGAANPQSPIVGIMPGPHLSSERGYYAGPFEVHLTTEIPGAEIRYTLNGGDPSGTAGIRYTNRLLINSTTTLRASVWKTNYLPSFPKTHTYLVGISATTRVLPALSVVTATNNLLGPTGIIGINGGTYTSGVWAPVNAATDYHNPSKHGIAWERPTSVEYFSSSNNLQFQADCGIRVQGSDYTRPRYTPNSKFSYRLYFRGDYGPGELEFPFFDQGAPYYDQIVLRAGHNDMTNPFLKDEFMRRIFLATGQVGVRGNFVNLYVNGVYKGYYNPTERVEEHFLRAWHGGNEEWDVVAQNNTALDGDMANFTAMMNFFRTHSMTNSNNYLEGARRLDYVNFIDYLIANIYGANGDWPQNNWRAGRERTANGIWRFYMWDAEFAFGTSGRTPTYDTFAAELTQNQEIPTLYKVLSLSPEFKLLFADRVNKHFYNGGALVQTNLVKIYTPLRNQLSVIIPNFNNIIETTWIPQRNAVLTNHFRVYGVAGAPGAPVFNQHGGRVPAGFQVSLSSPSASATIYYTTNGIDPRVMFTSAVAPTAQIFQAGQRLVLNETVQIKARARIGTNWTALTEAHFEVSEFGAAIRFTEVNYNPPGGDAYEFFELKNLGGTTVDLSGMSLNGVNFRFPEGSQLAAGAAVVIASSANPAAFAARYPNVPVGGYFENSSLSNGGERLSLLDRSENIVTWVDYKDSGGWPSEADGAGYTLELSDRAADPNTPGAWRKSSNLYGSPGSYEPATAPSVIVNEIFPSDGASGWIELQNTTSSSINLANYSFGDSSSARRFVFQGLVLPANSLVTASYSLPPSGSTLFLYDATTNRLDALKFGPLPTNATLARINGGWTLGDPTPAAANVALNLAAPSSITINEWLANPLPGEDDWIELHNNSDRYAAVQGLTLSLSNALYRIPSLLFIAPNGFLQLFATGEPGMDELPFKLPAAGAQLRLHDPTGVLLNTVNYAAQVENVSEGRLPDGGAGIAKFRGSLSPGTPNYLLSATSPLVINEVMSRNVRAVINPYGEASDWIELYNSGTTNIPLAGFTLSDDRDDPLQWSFPASAQIGANQYLVIWFDKTRPPSGDNTSRAINAEGGGVYLFNPQRQVIDQIEFGPQAVNLSIGRAGATWNLMLAPTPGALNSAFATLVTGSNVRINEWSTQWIELHNTSINAVTIAGMTLTDDLSLLGLRKFVFPPLSFIGPKSFTLLEASALDFRPSDQGESLRLYSTTFAASDTVAFSGIPSGGSLARLPDGSGAPNPAWPTPSQGNYLPLNDLRISRIDPTENRIFVRNISSNSVDLTGWTLSDDPLNPKQSLATNISGYGTVSFQPSFALDAAFGGVIVLAKSNVEQARLSYGAATNNLNYLALRTSLGLQSVPSTPKSIVIQEVMYHDSADSPEFEYVELRNASAVDLNFSGLRVNGGIQFNFPTNFVLPTGKQLVLVPFDPGLDATARAAFTNRFGVASTALLLGPYRGRLANSADTILIETPLPQTGQGYIPHVVIDQVSYTSTSPWPAAADGSGAALHRISNLQFGNEPVNWIAAAPSPGATTESFPPVDTDLDTLPDIWEIAVGLDPRNVADASGDLDADGVSNREEFSLGSDPTDPSVPGNTAAIKIGWQGAAPVLKFFGRSGQTIGIQRRESLDLPWGEITTLGPFNQDGEVEFPITVDAVQQRFYRFIR